MTTFLETERLVLRQFTADDVDDLLALDLDPLVRRFVEDGEPVTREEAADTIEHFRRYYERGDVFGFWATIEKDSGRFIGWFHFRPLPDAPADEPELGYRLVADAWNKGYGTEGSRALIDMGFRTPLVARVVAATMAVHLASRRVMEKAGMHHVRNFEIDWPVRIPGDEEGDVEYAITARSGRPHSSRVRRSLQPERQATRMDERRLRGERVELRRPDVAVGTLERRALEERRAAGQVHRQVAHLDAGQ